METTKISSSQTVGEIQHLLGSYGATAILLEYSNGEVIAVSFKIMVGKQEVPFRLPCRWEPIEGHLNKKHKPQKYVYSGETRIRDNTDQAKRVAWRQILRWIEAQLALTDTGMVKIQEVFLPYMLGDSGETLYEMIEKKQFMIEYKK